MNANDWREECNYITEQTEPFVLGYGPSEFEDKAQFVRYCTMQRNSATRQGFDDAAQYIQHCLDDMVQS
jgi:hypothetical protein